MSSETEDLSGTSAVVVPQQAPFSWKNFLRSNATQLGMILVFFGLWLFFILAAPQTFLSPQIYYAFMATTPFFAIMALPLTMVIIAGEMDLSFPSIMAIGMVAFIFVFEPTGNVALALLAALTAGVASGILNGALVVGIGIPSLVATIGTQFFLRGLSLVLLEGKGATLIAARESFVYELLVGRTIGKIPNQFWWSIAIAILCWVILNRTRLGAHIYLIGDNEKSARLMGVNVNHTRLAVFIMMGLAAAFAGVLASLQVSFFWPSLGEGYLLSTLASVFLGGTSVFGGTGTILGSFLGSYIIGAINAGIVAIGLTGFWTELIYGLIIVVSVSMHVVMQKRIK
ncbi:MAG: ABC transporter permease [Candidatus Promineifilaceae bacterium]|jgi:simple sugar transport system permease protein